MRLYPDRLGNKALMGYSMGAFQSLFIAATGPTNQYCVMTKGRVLRFLEGKQGVKEVRIAPVTNQVPLIQFDRYVAISPPVRLMHGVSKLDEFYRAPLDWPDAEPNRRHRKYFSQGGRLEQEHPHAANLPAVQRHRIQVSHRPDVSIHAAGHYLQQPAAE